MLSTKTAYFLNYRVQTSLRWISFCCLIFVATACSSDDGSNFVRVRERFTKEYFQILPEEAPPSIQVNQGTFGKLFMPSADNLLVLQDFYKTQRATLQDIDFHNLGDQHQAEYQKMVGILRSVYGYLSGFRNHPQYFNVQNSLQRSFAKQYSAQQQLDATILKLQQIPGYYDAAKSHLVGSSMGDAAAAVEQHIKTYQLLDQNIATYLRNQQQMTPEVENLLYYAKIAVKDYIAYCKSLEYEAKTMQANFRQ